MAIDRSGEWWIGDDPDDIDEYVAAYGSGDGSAQVVVHATCARCAGIEFVLEVDDLEGCAVRTCSSCGARQPMLDSADHVDDAELEKVECPTCGAKVFNVAVGFELRDGSDDVRWVYLQLRCVEDGVLGCRADWNIDYGPSGHLLSAV